jgi:Zn-dependent protease with chaperone function/uncharacterized membrane protein YciS (DUF1049 family)
VSGPEALGLGSDDDKGQYPNEDPAGGDPWLAAALEEYRSVREESLNAIGSHLATLRYGVTASALLVGIAVRYRADAYLGWLIALGIVPLVVVFVAILWMGEYARMARAGRYIVELEQRVSEHVARTQREAEPEPAPPLAWENWLREGGPDLSRQSGSRHRYVVIFAVLVAVELVSVAVGMTILWRGSDKPGAEWITPVAGGLNLIALATLAAYFRSSFENLRAYATTPSGSAGAALPRRRLRVRIALRVLLVVVGVLAAPWVIWIVSVLVLVLLPARWAYLVTVPFFLWGVGVPLLAPRSIMRSLLVRRRQWTERPATSDEQRRIARGWPGALLTPTELSRIRVAGAPGLNAPALGRDGLRLNAHVFDHREDLPLLVAHEMAHHRLGHLRPLALSYLYLWPYLYFDKARRPARGALARALRPVRAILRGACMIPGWVAWNALRRGFWLAEHDADRWAVQATPRGSASEPAPVQRAADRYAEILSASPEEDEARLAGLPVVREHPPLARRLKKLRRLAEDPPL